MPLEAINIIGAGQCGTLLAIMLARQGFIVDVFERNDDPRIRDAEAGRSINLALAARGINALVQAGLYEKIRPMLMPMRGRMVHHEDGRTELMPYGQQSNEVIYSVTRTDLNEVLLEVADAIPNVRLHFRQQAIGYDAPDRSVHVKDLRDGSLYQVEALPLFAADGAGSVIRRSFDGTDTFGGIESLLRHGYKELHIPPGPDGRHQLAADALHIWPRGGFMLIALPNPGGDFTLTLFLPNVGDAGNTGFSSLTDAAGVTRFFEAYFPDVAPLIENLGHDVIHRPLGLLGTVRCRHWHDRGNVLLIGDAAHAVVPFHGQGMNLAFEDCVVFDHLMRTEGGDWAYLFRRFEEVQLANANAIADMALENYIEMRDTVRDPKFALRKALAFELERQLPEYFIPRYSMVMFHADIPYAVAQERGAVQKALIEKHTDDAESLGQVDMQAALAATRKQLPPLDDVRVDRHIARWSANGG
ncbi:MAG TPA: NAD(P)/FAD-dependent oxidoreductase [Woeseiaceae bacterium]|nr:NAD(P)/FAD-dependent oxidoreductase [Woeseiaceae bacterium]